MLEIVKPMDIEKRSFEIITEKSMGSTSTGKPTACSESAICSASSAVVGATLARGVRSFNLGMVFPSGVTRVPAKFHE